MISAYGYLSEGSDVLKPGFLKQLVPEAKKAALIMDNSSTAQAFTTDVKNTALPIEIYEFYLTDDFDAWKAKVAELQTRVDALGLFAYHTLKEKGETESMPAEDVLAWTLANSKLPEFAITDFAVRGGALCGVTLSGYEQGKAAAEIAAKILQGEKPSNIPVQCPTKGTPLINEKRAKELNISIPEDVLKQVELVS